MFSHYFRNMIPITEMVVNAEITEGMKFDICHTVRDFWIIDVYPDTQPLYKETLWLNPGFLHLHL